MQKSKNTTKKTEPPNHHLEKILNQPNYLGTVRCFRAPNLFQVTIVPSLQHSRLASANKVTNEQSIL